MFLRFMKLKKEKREDYFVYGQRLSPHILPCLDSWIIQSVLGSLQASFVFGVHRLGR